MAKDITLDESRTITKEAILWKGTPYSMVGGNSEKGVSGDCSGTTYKIYTAAKFPYDYQSTAVFPGYAIASGLFRKLEPTEAMQDGDILYWTGHMAIYCTFYMDPDNAVTQRTNKNGQKYEQKNDMWTASHTGGSAYAPGKVSYFKPGTLPIVYRYQKK